MQKSSKHYAKIESLLEKGTEILWSKGYNGTSVNDIVKAAAVPKGSFYFYFDSKEDFAVKSLERYFEIMFGTCRSLLFDQSKSPRQRLLDYYNFRKEKMKNEFNCTKGCMACNIGNEMAEHSEKIRKTIVKTETEINNQITEVVKEAQKAGEITSSVAAKDIVNFIEDAGKGCLTTMKETQSAFPLDNFYNFLEHTIFK